MQFFHSLEQGIGAVGLFPGYTQFLPSEVTVGCQLTVDGPAQVQHVDNGLRTQVEDLFYGFCQNFVLHLAGAEGVYVDGYRMGHTNGIGLSLIHI